MLMINESFGFKTVKGIILGVILGFIPIGISAATIEQETLTYLKHIRSVGSDGNRKTIEDINKQMDAAWKLFNVNKKTVLPLLRKELSLELKKEKPNDLFILDIGYYIRLQDERSDKELGKQALLKIDTMSDIVKLNQQQLFQFAYDVATDQDPIMLSWLDKIFLKNKITAFVPQHSLTLDETLVCVFLYGNIGKTAETHLKLLISDQKLAPKIIEILIWIGSPDSIQEVTTAITARRDYETFVRMTAFMMKVGGPEGRAVMLSIDPKMMDAKSQEYYLKIKKNIESTSYDVLRKRFKGIQPVTALSDDELKKHLSVMYLNFGRDDETNPEAILDSRLPRQFLVSELTRIRDRMFLRLSDEALSDISMTNEMLNTLRYRSY